MSDDAPFNSRTPVADLPAAAVSSRPSRSKIKQERAVEEAKTIPKVKSKPLTKAAAAAAAKAARNAAAADGGKGDGESGPGWDRELDSDPEEPLNFEEHFILRVPLSVAPALRAMVEKKQVTSDVGFQFKDSRRAVFTFGQRTFGAKLVDLPTLVESQKMTGVGGGSVKVADISQMLLVEEELDEGMLEGGEDKNGKGKGKERAFNIEDFIFPHGITPPLKHVRKRRFRKRANKRTIETVEKAVEKLLQDDGLAEDVKYELLENYNSDSEYGSDDESKARRAAAAKGDDQSSMGAPTPRAESAMGEGEEGEEDDDDGGSGFDSDLEAQINAGLEAMNVPQAVADDSESDNDGLFGASSGSDDDDEDTATPEELEHRQRVKLLVEEGGDLDRAIRAKEIELSKVLNPMGKKRVEAMIKKLTSDRELKTSQHATAVREGEQRRVVAEAVVAADQQRETERKAERDVGPVPLNVQPSEKEDLMDES